MCARVALRPVSQFGEMFIFLSIDIRERESEAVPERSKKTRIRVQRLKGEPHSHLHVSTKERIYRQACSGPTWGDFPAPAPKLLQRDDRSHPVNAQCRCGINGCDVTTEEQDVLKTSTYGQTTTGSPLQQPVTAYCLYIPSACELNVHNGVRDDN